MDGRIGWMHGKGSWYAVLEQGQCSRYVSGRVGAGLVLQVCVGSGWSRTSSPGMCLGRVGLEPDQLSRYVSGWVGARTLQVPSLVSNKVITSPGAVTQTLKAHTQTDTHKTETTHTHRLQPNLLYSAKTFSSHLTYSTALEPTTAT